MAIDCTVFTVGIIGNAPKRISTIRLIWTMETMTILIRKHVEESRRNSINETEKLRDVDCSGLLLSLILVYSASLIWA